MKKSPIKERFKVDGSSRPGVRPVRSVAVCFAVIVLAAGCRETVDSSAREELASAHALSLEDAEQAIERATSLKKRFPQWDEPNLLIGRLHAIEGSIAEAEQALRRSLELHPEGRQSALWFARVALAAGDAAVIEDAERILERQIAADSGDIRLYHALGTLLETQGDMTGALGAYALGLERLTDTARLHLDAARLYHRLGLSERAYDRAETARLVSEELEGPISDAAEQLQNRIDTGSE